MPRNTIDRITDGVAHIVPWRIATIILVLVGAAQPAQAQFGGLKRLKKAFTQPDSAVQAKDSASTPIAAAADSGKSKRSFFSRAAAAAGNASDKFEKTTGISAKDAALAASGVGVAGLIAKKAGLPDPGSIVGNAVNNAAGNALQQRVTGSGIGAGALPSGIIGQKTATSAATLKSGAASRAAMIANNGLSSAGVGTPGDAAAMLAFQQMMMQTATAASSGDASARSRLDAWQAIALKYQAQAENLTAAAAAGNPVAVRRLQEMQISMIKEWTGAQNLSPRIVKP